MSEGFGPTTFETDGRIVFLSLAVYIAAAVLAGLAYAVGQFLVGLGGRQALVVAAAVGAGVVLLLYDRARSTTYEFRPDRLVEEMDPVVGGSRTEVPYDEVALVTREQSRRQSLLDAATFELVREDDDLTLKYVAPADAVEDELRDRVPTPGEWLDDHGDGDTALHAMVAELHHWRYGERLRYDRPDDGYDEDDIVHGTPDEAAVVTEAELADVADVGTDSLDVDGLADVDGVDDVADLDAGDVADHDVGGHDHDGGFDGDVGGHDHGGGFDGGGGGGGPE